VPNAKGVVFTFFAFGKAGQALGLTHGEHAFAAAGQYFVGVCLVTHVPHQAVARCFIDVMQRDSQFNHAQACAKMAAGLADAIQEKSA
jgi:hypothetical protein